MKKITTVESFIKAHPKWSQGLRQIRELILSCGLQESIKWGMPVYTFQTKNLVGMGAFKSHYGIWFYQGALLKDHENKLINAQEGKTQAMRQWRFTEEDEVTHHQATVVAYIREAVAHQKAGRTVQMDKSPRPLILTDELKEMLASDETLAGHFDALSEAGKREYADYILEAKRSETRSRRLARIAPMIRAGKKLNDLYRK